MEIINIVFYLIIMILFYLLIKQNNDLKKEQIRLRGRLNKIYKDTNPTKNLIKIEKNDLVDILEQENSNHSIMKENLNTNRIDNKYEFSYIDNKANNTRMSIKNSFKRVDKKNILTEFKNISNIKNSNSSKKITLADYIINKNK